MQFLRREAKRKAAARAVFCVGLVFSLAGSALILLSSASLVRQRLILSFSLLIIGGLCVFLAIKLKRRPLYLFFAVFFILVALFALFEVTKITKLTLKQSWPLLSVFAGLALMTAGRGRYGVIRRIYLVPSIALILLGGFLMLFSLRITGFSFRQFVIGWGPAVIVISGIALILLSFGNRDRT